LPLKVSSLAMRDQEEEHVCSAKMVMSAGAVHACRV
jgi:hypothetical protein